MKLCNWKDIIPLLFSVHCILKVEDNLHHQQGTTMRPLQFRASATALYCRAIHRDSQAQQQTGCSPQPLSRQSLQRATCALPSPELLRLCRQENRLCSAPGFSAVLPDALPECAANLVWERAQRAILVLSMTLLCKSLSSLSYNNFLFWVCWGGGCLILTDL